MERTPKGLYSREFRAEAVKLIERRSNYLYRKAVLATGYALDERMTQNLVMQAVKQRAKLSRFPG